MSPVAPVATEQLACPESSSTGGQPGICAPSFRKVTLPVGVGCSAAMASAPYVGDASGEAPVVTVAVRSPAPSDCTCVDVAVRDPIAADVVSTRAELLLSSGACRPTATHAASFASGTHE